MSGPDALCYSGAAFGPVPGAGVSPSNGRFSPGLRGENPLEQPPAPCPPTPISRQPHARRHRSAASPCRRHGSAATDTPAGTDRPPGPCPPTAIPVPMCLGGPDTAHALTDRRKSPGDRSESALRSAATTVSNRLRRLQPCTQSPTARFPPPCAQWTSKTPRHPRGNERTDMGQERQVTRWLIGGYLV
jgi:hypothetical protein